MHTLCYLFPNLYICYQIYPSEVVTHSGHVAVNIYVCVDIPQHKLTPNLCKCYTYDEHETWNVPVYVVEIQGWRRNHVWFHAQVTAALVSGVHGVSAVPSVDQDCITGVDRWAKINKVSTLWVLTVTVIFVYQNINF